MPADLSIQVLLAATLALGALIVVLAVILLRRSNGGSGRVERTLREELVAARREAAEIAERARGTQGADLRAFAEDLHGRLVQTHGQQLDQLERMAATSDWRLEAVREAVERQLGAIRGDNNAQLERMRATVEEKLQGTLERRLGEAFHTVSLRLEQVHAGLGEMRRLAEDVGSLQRVLTNVKTRGTWGEVQLGALLEQILPAAQFARNVRPRPRLAETVEFAIRLPGAGGEDGAPVWLPIDAKFPVEDWRRLSDAQERADAAGVEQAGRALEEAVLRSARDIATKYLEPPHTTDFGILFLPTESLYAEVLRRPGVCERVQREQRVVIAGPTTLAALLNSLQMGFRTLAIQRRSNEVWLVLEKVRGEFGKFGEAIEAVGKKLEEATNKVRDLKTRRSVLTRALARAEGVADEPLDGAEEIAGPTPLEPPQE